jgi:hypothetical protein
MRISHYRASWIKGADQWPPPAHWPPAWTPSEAGAYLYGGGKPALQGPLTLSAPFRAGTRLRLHVDTVSGAADFTVKADGKIIFGKQFVSGPGAGEWKQSVYMPQYHVYQNIFDRDYAVMLPRNADMVEFSVGAGDWLRFSEIGITPPGGKESVLRAFSAAFGMKPGVIYLNAEGMPDARNISQYSGAWLVKRFITPWKRLEESGVGVFVEEWGAYNRTPHAVVLAWMKDCLDNWRKAGWGWALWNFRGSFGILDSGRKDVQYEDFHGHKLDRAMLELLQKN